MQNRTVADVMTREVFAVAPATSLNTAARLLAKRHISGAPVVDATGRVMGVVTLTDIADPDRTRSCVRGTSKFFYQANGHLTDAYAEFPKSREGIVADVMSPFVLAVSSKALLIDAVRLMVTDEVHRLLVLDNGELVGVITSSDVMRALVAADRDTAVEPAGPSVEQPDRCAS